MVRAAALLALCIIGAGPSSEEIRGMRHPALSPDGTRLAFDWHGDLWICPAEGGPAERITDDPAHEQKPCWSPDGKQLAFSSDKTGNLDLYVVDLATRKVRPLTFHSADDDSPSWSGDGKWIAFQSNRDSNLDLPLNNNVWDLWRMPAEGGTATRITRFRGENPAWSPDGKWIAYDRYSSGYADGEHNIFLIAPDGSGVPRELASGIEDSRHPVFKGTQVYFSHEANGIKQASTHRNVWRTTVNGGPLLQVTGHREEDVKWPTTSPAGNVLVYEQGFSLYSIDLRVALPAPKKLSITANFQYGDPSEVRSYSSGFRTPAWSPSGSRIAFSSRGQIWVTDADGRDARSLTRGAADRRDPSWTTDEKALLYAGGPPGMPCHLWSVGLDGREPKRLTTQELAYRHPHASPDGNRVVFALPDGVWILDLKTGARKKLFGEENTGYEWTRFSPDGESVAWLSTQSGKTAIEVARIGGDRPEGLASPEAKSGLAWSPDGKRLAFGAASGEGGWKLRVWEPQGAGDKALTQGGRNPTWSPDGSMLVAEIERGQGVDNQALMIFDTTSNHRLAVDIKASRPVSRREEMLGVFLQVWSSYAGNYYDPFFHGVDWGTMRDKYRAFAEESQTKAELYDVINDMIRELHSSHIHLTPAPLKNSAATGSLAADLAADEDGTLRVVRVEPNGPADKAGIREGEVIVSAGGTPLTAGTDFDRLLSGEGGSPIPEVPLGVRNAAGETRTVSLRGLDRSALRELKYENRIAWRKKFTRERSGGRLAYHHIKMMVQPEVNRLKKALEEEFPDAEGLVLDERDGVGGLAHRPVCALLDSTAADRLNASPACFTRNRNGTSAPDKYGQGAPGGRNPGKSWDKPVIMVMNEISRSDKEILPFTFRYLGIGYLVGMPTAGGVIGGNEWTMQDGSKITVSVQGWFSADGRNLEGYGVPPDYRTPETHEDLLAGRDAPLEKAIEVLLAQMEGRIGALRKPGLEKKGDSQQGK
jgi:Tol biopolymer transport system component/C-terminal processing protease CtpA/Prc